MLVSDAAAVDRLEHAGTSLLFSHAYTVLMGEDPYVR